MKDLEPRSGAAEGELVEVDVRGEEPARGLGFQEKRPKLEQALDKVHPTGEAEEEEEGSKR